MPCRGTPKSQALGLPPRARPSASARGLFFLTAQAWSGLKLSVPAATHLLWGGRVTVGRRAPLGRSLQLRAGGLREMPRARSRGWLLSVLPLVGEALFLRPCLRAGLAWPHLSRSGSFCFALGLPGASGAYAGGAILEVVFSHLPGLSFCCCRCARVPLAIWGLAGKSSATILAGSWPGARQGRRCLRSGPPGARSSGEA